MQTETKAQQSWLNLDLECSFALFVHPNTIHLRNLSHRPNVRKSRSCAYSICTTQCLEDKEPDSRGTTVAGSWEHLIPTPRKSSGCTNGVFHYAVLLAWGFAQGTRSKKQYTFSEPKSFSTRECLGVFIEKEISCYFSVCDHVSQVVILGVCLPFSL